MHEVRAAEMLGPGVNCRVCPCSPRCHLPRSLQHGRAGQRDLQGALCQAPKARWGCPCLGRLHLRLPATATAQPEHVLPLLAPQTLWQRHAIVHACSGACTSGAARQHARSAAACTAQAPVLLPARPVSSTTHPALALRTGDAHARGRAAPAARQALALHLPPHRQVLGAGGPHPTLARPAPVLSAGATPGSGRGCILSSWALGDLLPQPAPNV